MVKRFETSTLENQQKSLNMGFTWISHGLLAVSASQTNQATEQDLAWSGSPEGIPNPLVPVERWANPSVGFVP